MRSNPTTESDPPRFACSPWASFGLVAFVGFAWISSGAEPFGQLARQRTGGPREVTERGDLDLEERSTIELFRSASPSVVNITNVDVRVTRARMRMNETAIPQGTGTGLIWDDEGIIVTNYHVVHQADRIVVTLSDRSQWEAEVLGVAPDFDLAVVRVDLPDKELRALPLGSSSDVLVGQNVYAIGNPFGLDQTLTTGVVSGLNREITSLSGRAIRDVIQTDAAINPGNSGGPLLDSAGRLIGINTAIASPSGGSAGIGFAVPVDTVNRVVPELIRNGRFVRPTLGIYMAPDAWSRELGLRGVLIRGVADGSGADLAGLRDAEFLSDGSVRGDVITAINGRTIRDQADLLHVIAQHRPGETVKVDLERGGRELSLDIRLSQLR